MRIIWLIWLFGLGSTILSAQVDSIATLPSGLDSTKVATDTIKRNTFKEMFRGKPGRAALYSLLIPAGGQVYNKKWLKIPLSLAIEGGAATWLIYNRNQFKYYDQIFDDMVAGKLDNPEGFRTPREAKVSRDSSRKQTEYAWVIMILAHLYNVFDAYVDRQLMDFDISEDLTFKTFAPQSPYGLASVGFVYQF